MVTIIAPNAFCPACDKAAPEYTHNDGTNVCGHKHKGGWSCSYCGEPAVNKSGLKAIIACTVSTAWSGFTWELSLGKMSKYKLVQWWASR